MCPKKTTPLTVYSYFGLNSPIDTYIHACIRIQMPHSVLFTLQCYNRYVADKLAVKAESLLAMYVALRGRRTVYIRRARRLGNASPLEDARIKTPPTGGCFERQIWGQTMRYRTHNPDSQRLLSCSSICSTTMAGTRERRHRALPLACRVEGRFRQSCDPSGPGFVLLQGGRFLLGDRLGAPFGLNMTQSGIETPSRDCQLKHARKGWEGSGRWMMICDGCPACFR